MDVLFFEVITCKKTQIDELQQYRDVKQEN